MGGLYGESKWNDDPEWARYIRRFESVIQAIAAKKTTDLGIRQDCEQEARLGLLSVFPETVKGYERYVRGQLSEADWNANLDRYCRNVIRNSILSYLDSPKTGNWRIGRTKRVLNRKTGKRVKKYEPPRYSSLDELVEDGGLQIDEDGQVTWMVVNNDGLDFSNSDYEDDDDDLEEEI